MSNTAIPATPAHDVYAMFSGTIDAAGIQRIMSSAGGATQVGHKHFHLLFQSPGGAVGDGICLYNFFRKLPLDLTIYNSGNVASIAVIAYLGVKTRKASANATFMIHRTYAPAQIATAIRLHTMTKSTAIDDGRTEAILREHLKLTSDHWDALDKDDVYFTAKEALDIGLIHKIDDFSPPAGAILYGV